RVRFVFVVTETSGLSPLSLHDALPIWWGWSLWPATNLALPSLRAFQASAGVLGRLLTVVLQFSTCGWVRTGAGDHDRGDTGRACHGVVNGRGVDRVQRCTPAGTESSARPEPIEQAGH